MKQFIVDAFTPSIFKGNPAAVCLLEAPLEDRLLQSIAIENNLSETAFLLRRPDGRLSLRWFTPGGEIDLCGHATLGSAFVYLTEIEPQASAVAFETRSGTLTVTRTGSRFSMDFPAYPVSAVPVTNEMEAAFGVRPAEAYLARDLLCVFESAEAVEQLKPDQTLLSKLPGLLQSATAPGSSGSSFDCVSRSFAPKLRVAEDPVCGSAHCHIVPYWVQRLHKADLVCFQASARTGVMYCHFCEEAERVAIAGEAVLFSRAEINLSPARAASD